MFIDLDLDAVAHGWYDEARQTEVSAKFRIIMLYRTKAQRVRSLGPDLLLDQRAADCRMSRTLQPALMCVDLTTMPGLF